MSIFTINFNNRYKALLPPSKRTAKQLSFGYSLLYPLQYLRDLFFDDYVDGASYSAWSNLALYNPGDRVRYTDRAIYECIVATNFGDAPTDATYWTKIQDNYMGVNERVNYTGQHILLARALNRWFMNSLPSPLIYIQTNSVSSAFVMGQDGNYSSALYNDSNFSQNFMVNTYSNTQYDFTIYFPLALYNALPPTTTTEKDNLIKDIVNKYRIAGTTFNITTY